MDRRAQVIATFTRMKALEHLGAHHETAAVVLRWTNFVTLIVLARLASMRNFWFVCRKEESLFEESFTAVANLVVVAFFGVSWNEVWAPSMASPLPLHHTI